MEDVENNIDFACDYRESFKEIKKDILKSEISRRPNEKSRLEECNAHRRIEDKSDRGKQRVTYLSSL